MDILETIGQMITRLEKQKYRGYDPYDALNMPVPWQKMGRWLPAIAIQTLKHSPVNLRPLLGIKPGYNPKAMALFLQAFCLLYKKTGDPEYLKRADFFFEWLNRNNTKTNTGIGWGYNFLWVSPIRNLPPYTPSAVVTAFVCKGIYAYYQQTQNSEAANCLSEAADFVLHDLPVFEDETGINYSYTPLQEEICYNASLLAAEILAYRYSLHNDKSLKSQIESACNFVVTRQKEDGYWNYSENPENGKQRAQVDFHQGFIIESLDIIQQLIHTEDKKYQDAISKGLCFYKERQFAENGRPFYRLPEKFPADIHHVAQGILTFARLSSPTASFPSFSYTIAGWAIKNMYSPRGYFYYRKGRSFVNRIDYIRWAQAWMLLALSEIL
jgi:hypothetical protein